MLLREYKYGNVAREGHVSLVFQHKLIPWRVSRLDGQGANNSYAKNKWSIVDRADQSVGSQISSLSLASDRRGDQALLQMCDGATADLRSI